MTAASNEVVAGELRALIAKATDEDLADGGLYWAESLADLTQCLYGDMGHYDDPSDGELIEWLWNRRVEIAGLYEARAHSDPRPVAEGLREALTPSADTKAAYIGEFSFNIIDRDEDGEEAARRVLVPWDTIKEIMAAIAARAATHSPAPMAGGVDNG